ncbi:ARM repeat protein interacting WITH ABF2 protein, partial [Trifolium medium]|nr:ARM repeat protein interacting WITH ABF2 protein [Trifolium medium]
DSHNQAGIAYNGGIEPLLKLLGTKNTSVQHNASFALYALADNEDNVAVIIKAGGFQKLHEGHFNAQLFIKVTNRTSFSH